MTISLEQGEKIVVRAHKHWFVYVVQILPFSLFSIIPIVYFFVAGTPIESTGPSLPLFFSGVLYLILWILLFISWTDYYLDVFILTDRRVMYISQKSLFTRKISTSRLDRVQDVSIEVSGMMPTFLNYGDIFIQTAAEDREFIIHDIPNPDVIKDKILSKYTSVLSAPTDVRITNNTNSDVSAGQKNS